MSSVYVEVEVDLSEFSDEDIEAEYAERFGEVHSKSEDTERLEAIFHAMRLNRPDVHTLMWDYVRDKLGKAA